MAGPHYTAEQTTELRRALLTWFDQHKRDLPWRRTRDPYAIWVSEIMLQQTRVAAVLDHYARWMARFPTVSALASADEPEVLALWSGLGYYRRARFLHQGAQAVMADHAGTLPNTAAALRTLPGIGEYTSAAIASIAFNEPIAVVDGNVERVIMRLAGLALATGKEEPAAPDSKTAPRALAPTPLAREIRILANALLAPERPGDANQAVMELGATVCLPRAPLCLHCPVQPWCATRGEHIGAPRKAMQSRSIAYALAQREHRGGTEILLAQRPASASLMPGMWELPELPTLPNARTTLLTLRHAITITNYIVRIVACPEPETLNALELSQWVPVTQLPDIALTGLARKALKRLALWPQTVSQ
jgi:A/G-specific adenine glycosylase